MVNGDLYAIKISEKLKHKLHALKWDSREEIFWELRLNQVVFMFANLI